MRAGFVLLSVALTLGSWACRSDGKGSGPPVPASSDPEGKDLVEGAIVIATEKCSGNDTPTPAGHCGVRIYKVKEVSYFPPPMGDELVLIAFNEKGNDFQHAADLWRQGKLTVALPNVRVSRSNFNHARDYRVIATLPVTELDKQLKQDDPLPKP